ncbi:MAG TPA: YlbF family regulator [Longimicrobiales bacterium]|nr:YlbF family regulator [Longimicrobiales bacterium]
MTEGMQERARELGRLLGQSDEYKALERARKRLTEDAEAVSTMNRLDVLEREIAAALQNAQDPPDATKEEYERRFLELQATPVYQGLVAAQSNFDKVLARVNQEISHGMEAGAQSRIILPS